MEQYQKCKVTYPCEECLIDVVCKEFCNNLIFYSDYLMFKTPDGVPEFLIKTDIRFNRLRYCILEYGGPAERVVRLDNYLITARRKFLEQQK
jgi:hypothetical protein